MQTPKTYALRGEAHYILCNQGPTSLAELARIIGCEKEELRYAIESTFPFDAMFKKIVAQETVYEAVPIDEVYDGEEEFY